MLAGCAIKIMGKRLAFDLNREAAHLSRRMQYETLEDRRVLTTTVIHTSPANGTEAVDGNVEIQAWFSKSIGDASVNDLSFTVRSSFRGSYLTDELNDLTAAGNLITMSGDRQFMPGEIIQAAATSTLQDTSGAPISPYLWEFRTATQGGSGLFVSGQTLEGAATNWDAAFGDLDGDGDLDAIITNMADPFTVGYTRIWFNQGGKQGGQQGDFIVSEEEIYSTRHHDVALGDLDNDGDLDIFFCNSTSQPNTIYINQGGLQEGVEGEFADSGQRLGDEHSRGIALGDLDGDGDLDAFIANRLQPGFVWINQGGQQGGQAGVFIDSGQRLGTEMGYDVVVGDIDGDGDLDAIVMRGEVVGGAEVWFNDGDGAFVAGPILGIGIGHSLALGDVDGDGDLDAFLGLYGADEVWINQGGAQEGVMGEFADSGQKLGFGQTHDVDLGDLDGDGDLDAFTVSLDLIPDQVFINQGGAQGGVTGEFLRTSQAFGMGGNLGVALGDVDGDGDLDALIAGFGPNNTLWINQNSDADFDDDGFVDGADFLIWQRQFGETGTDLQGDADRDGVVSSADLYVWTRQFNDAAVIDDPPPPVNQITLAEEPPFTAVSVGAAATSKQPEELRRRAFDALAGLALPGIALHDGASHKGSTSRLSDSQLADAIRVRNAAAEQAGVVAAVPPLATDEALEFSQRTIEIDSLYHRLGDTSVSLSDAFPADALKLL